MSDDPRRLLDDAARVRPAAVDADRLWRRGRRRRARRLVAGSGAALAVVAAAALAFLPGDPPAPITFGTAPDQTEDPAEPGDGTDADPGSEHGEPCPDPPYRPTYLPWLTGDGTAGEADARLGGTADAPSVTLYWLEDPAAFERHRPSYDGAAVTVSTNADLEHEHGSGEFREVGVHGHAGEVVWVGDPGIGGVVVVWREREGPCGSYSVGFDMTRPLLGYIDVPPATGEDVDDAMLDLERAIEAELVRVVESLVREERDGG